MSNGYSTSQARELLNEAQTRYELIDPALTQRGWQPGIDIKVEVTAAPVDIVYGTGRRRKKGWRDYVLRRPLKPETEPIPLAIIEATPAGLSRMIGPGQITGSL